MNGVSGRPHPGHLPAGERGWLGGGWGCFVTELRTGGQFLANAFSYAFVVLHDLVVPETDDAVAERFERGGALLVVFHSIGMLAAVDLDDQLLLQAEEIDDVRADGLLAAEFVACELAVAQGVPEELLGVGLVPSQGPCE